ncbi:MAG: hypothetical protein Q8K75_11395 [Chlamydiales bacterium]|nr:hypothetical protein [Chlamydiales bacterium]
MSVSVGSEGGSLPLSFFNPATIDKAAPAEVRGRETTGSVQPKPLTKEPEQLKGELKTVLCSKHANIQDRSKAFMQVALQSPAVKEKFQQLEALKAKYPNTSKAIETKPWKSHCSERGLDMTKPHGDEEISLEEYRTVMNAAIDEVAVAIGKEAGCPNAFFGACGTVAYNSDVDTAIIGKGLTPVDANIYASARNEVHTAILGGHSGPQFDTEAYIPHPAKYNTSGALSKSPEAHARYIACEKANVALQYHVSLGAHPEEYQKAKDDYLSGIKDPVHKEGMTIIFSQVEAMMDHLESKVNSEILLQNGFSETEVQHMSDTDIQEKASHIRHDNPEAYKAARENVIPNIRTSVGELVKSLDQKIEGLVKQNQRFPEAQQLDQLDKLHNQRNEVFSIMNILQDEGTNSQAEGKITLLQEGGQMHAGAQKKAVSQLAESDKNQSGVTAFLLAKGGGEISDQLYKNQLRTTLVPKGFEKPDAETLHIAADEESPQRIHTFNDAMRGLDGATSQTQRDSIAMNALGNSKQAKYAARTTTNNFRALDDKMSILKSSGSTIPPGCVALKHRAEKLMETSDNLLKCMRRDSLGKEATEQLLSEHLSGSSDDSVMVKAKVRKVVDLFEPGGREDGKPFEKFEKVNLMVREMVSLGILDDRNTEEVLVKNEKTSTVEKHILPKDPEIRKILQGRAGFSIESPDHQDLIPLHDRALEITCKSLKLDTEAAAYHFNSQVIQLNKDCENLFIDQGWTPKVDVNIAKSMDLLGTLLSATGSTNRSYAGA